MISSMLTITNKQTKLARDYIRTYGNKIGLRKADKEFGFTEGTMEWFFQRIANEKIINKQKEKEEEIKAVEMLKFLKKANETSEIF